MEVWGQVWAAQAPRVLFHYVVTWLSWTWMYNRLRWVLKSTSEKIRERDLYAKASLNQLQIFCTILEAMPGGSHVARVNFKMSCVSVYKCLSFIVGFAITVAIWPREVVSLRFHFTRCGYFLFQTTFLLMITDKQIKVLLFVLQHSLHLSDH